MFEDGVREEHWTDAVECGGHSTTRSSTSTTTNTTNTNSTKMKSLLLGDIRSKSIVPGTTAQWIEVFALRFVLWPVAVVPTRIRNNGCDDRNRSDLSLRTAKPSFPDGSYIHITKFVPRASIMRGEMNLQKHLYTQSIS